MPAIGLWLAAALVFALQALIQTQELHGIRLLEQRPIGYTPAEAHAFLAGLGPSGRAWYTGFQGLDLLLIASLTGAMISTDRWGLARAGVTGPLRLAIWLAAAYAVTDLVEDGVLVRMIATFPDEAVVLSRAAPVLTLTKFVAVGGSIAGMLAIVAIALRR